MQGYNPDLQGRFYVVAQPAGSSHDRGSPSASDDDAPYLAYPDPDSHKMEHYIDDDPSTALTSQTLNADGTPKRPMNAFMIFARRRRPQVAAENQSMRTGEVSKILSREWNAMGISEKQFYLDQAKLLKDNFNQKYPDYVYKRRPNNSRKRRKPDPAPGSSADHVSSSELADDYAGGADYNDVSPLDVADTDDPHASGEDLRYPSMPPDPSGGTYPAIPSRASSFQPPDVSYRPLGDTRTSYMSRPGRSTPDAAAGSSLSSAARGSEHGTNYYHLYMSAQQQHHAHSSSHFTESGSTGDMWSGATDNQSRVHPQSWSQDSHDLSANDRHRGYPQQVSSQAWTGGTPEGMPTTGPPVNFPTLTSPFYPQSSAQEGFSSSSVQPVSIPPQHFGAPAPGSQASGRSYPSLQQAYSSASAMGSYQPHSRAVSLSGSARPMPPYPQAQPTSPPPPAGSGGDPSQMQYWSRDR